MLCSFNFQNSSLAVINFNFDFIFQHQIQTLEIKKKNLIREINAEYIILES
jgi:hypothetical protein